MFDLLDQELTGRTGGEVVEGNVLTDDTDHMARDDEGGYGNVLLS
jgi:hypothetical protein